MRLEITSLAGSQESITISVTLKSMILFDQYTNLTSVKSWLMRKMTKLRACMVLMAWKLSRHAALTLTPLTLVPATHTSRNASGAGA
jgi:hypothetical protein